MAREVDLPIVVRAKDEASAVLDQIGNKFKTTARVIGTAMTSVGVAGYLITASAQKMNADLANTALTVGITTKEMRNLALGITDVSLPLKELIPLMDMLARAGIKDTDELKKAAKGFDDLAEATGQQVNSLADQLIPAFKMFGMNLTNVGQYSDKFVWLVKNTTLDLGDFGSAMQWVAREGKALGVTLDDMIAIMAVLESRGITGTVATRMFRSAVTEAAEKGVSLNSVLKITDAELDTYKTKLDGATGITAKYVKASESQYTLLDKLKQKWSEITLKLGTVMQPIQALFAVMTTLGPVFLFLSTSIGIATARFVAHTAALIATGNVAALLTPILAGLRVAFAAMTGPIGIAIAAMAAIGVALWSVFHRTSETKKYIKELQKAFAEIKADAAPALAEIAKRFAPLIAKAKEAGNAEEEVNLVFQKASATIRAHQQTIANLNVDYEAMVKLKGEASAEAKNMKADIDAETQSLETAKDAVDDLAKSYGDLLGTAQGDLKNWKDMVADYDRQVTEANQEVIDKEKALTGEYESQLAARISALAGWMDFWSGTVNKAEETAHKQKLAELEAQKTGIKDPRNKAARLAEIDRQIAEENAHWNKAFTHEELQANLQSQVDWLNEWQAQVSSISAKTVEEGFLAEIRKMGPEALPQLRALNSMTAEELTAYVSLWKDKTAIATAEATAELDPLWVNIQAQIKVIKDALPSKLAEIGTVFGENFATWGTGVPDILAIMTADMIKGKVPFDKMLASIGTSIDTNLGQKLKDFIAQYGVAQAMNIPAAAGVVPAGGLFTTAAGATYTPGVGWMASLPKVEPNVKAPLTFEQYELIDKLKVLALRGNLPARIQLYEMGVEGYQYGGVVPGPIGAPVPAIVHGGEEIVPPEKRLDKVSQFSEWMTQILGSVAKPLSFAIGGVVPGPIGAPVRAVVHGGERITPHGRAATAVSYTVNVHVAGSVIAQQDLGYVVRQELLRIKDRNYSLGF